MRLGILGSTGSIGRSVLEVIRTQPQFKVHTLSAHSQLDKLCEQVHIHKPSRLVVGSEKDAHYVREKLAPNSLEILYGEEGLIRTAQDDEIDWLVNALAGTNGLLPTFHALEKGKRVLLANKESLVSAGRLLMDLARKNDTLILPIDSEHNAVLRCLPQDYVIGDAVEDYGVRSLWLTASGGPFLDKTMKELIQVSPAQARQHPNWNMGAKISVDSATLMNKGLELIEAQILFNIASEKIKIVIHPQSIVHCLVEYEDGSFIAQLSRPDMKLAVHQALHYPCYEDFPFTRMTPYDMSSLTFARPNEEKFPCLRLARRAAEEEKFLPIVMNAANNQAVEAFLSNQLAFTSIAAIVGDTMEYFAKKDNGPLPQKIQDIQRLEELSAAYVQERIEG